MDEAHDKLGPHPLTVPGPKKPYRPPSLTLFGEVAVLTQGSNCSAANDGSGSCPSSGGSAMGMVSDRRLKQDIVHIGEHPLGFGLYLFRYVPAYRDECGHGRHFGAMADEVARARPDAVATRPDGYSMVNYGMIGISTVVH